MRVGEFTPNAKALIRGRANGRCEMCGLLITMGAQYHHRKPRRAGGTSDRRIANVSNGVFLHPRCHDKVEANRAWALERGWLLHAAEWPEEVPVRMWNGWFLLVGSRAVPSSQSLGTACDDDGSPGEAAAGLR